MTTRTPHARWLLSAVLSTGLGVASAACSDSDSPSDTAGDTSPSTTDASVSVPDATTVTDTGDAGGDKVAACLGAVYSELSDSCSACACNVNAQLAPSCGKPCWDFIACASVAQTGKCAESAAGGAATRPQFEACTMAECGAFLAVPGAQVVGSYTPITVPCVLPVGSAPGICADDIAKFAAALPKP